MGDSRCSYGGSSWFPSEGGGGAWIPSDGSAPCIISDGGGARNPSDGGGSHGLCGKASYDPAAMAPSYGPHRLHPPAARHRSTPYHPPVDAGPRAFIPAKAAMGRGSIPYHPPADAGPRALIPAKADLFSMGRGSIPYHPPADARPRALIPAKGPNADLFSMDHYYDILYHPPADARPSTISQSASIPAKGPNADLVWMDHYYGQEWDDCDDNGDDPDREPIECRICNRESDHITLNCPFMVLTRQLDVLMRTPQEKVRYYYCYMEDDDTNECTEGYGISYYLPPCQKNVECCAADAMMLHKDGMNLVRVTGLPWGMAEPKILYELLVKIGPLTNVIVFPDHALAFVNFVSEEAARRAIKRFNGSGLGRLMWATQKPY